MQQDRKQRTALLASGIAVSSALAVASPAFSTLQSAQSPRPPCALQAAAQQPPRAAAPASQSAWSLGLGVAATATLAAAVRPSQRARRSGRWLQSARCAEAEEKGDDEPLIDWGPRMGFKNERPMPANCEEFGSTIWYEVELEKPFGLDIQDGPQGPGTGTGVGKVKKGGSADKLRQEAIDGKPVMWIQEGDQLCFVDDIDVKGSRDKAVELVTNAPGPKVKLTMARPRRGHILVQFPNKKCITVPRGTKLSVAAAAVGYDCGSTRKDGRDPKLWHRDVYTGESYCLALDVPGVIPSTFREANGQIDMNEGQFECWVPMKLEPAPEAYQEEVEREQKIMENNRKIRGGP